MTALNRPSTHYRRLKRKGAGIISLVIVMMMLGGMASVLITLLVPVLPAPYQRVLERLLQDDWAGSLITLQDLFAGYGWSSAVAFLAAQVIQVLLAPIPGQVLGFLGGYLFGFWQGLGLSMLGLTIGSSIAMGLSRIFGDYVVRKLAPQPVVARFDYLVDNGGLWNFFVLFLLPAVPDDVLCLLAGLTRISMWKLVLVCVLGRLPGMAALSFVGSGADQTGGGAFVVLGITMIATAILWLFSPEVEAYVVRLSHRRDSQSAPC